MRPQFTLLGLLLATALVALVAWRFAPRTQHVVIEKTGRALDLAIVGEGYFSLVRPDGFVIYSRSGRFLVNANGQIEQETTGYILDPTISIPASYRRFEVKTNGEVWVTLQQRDATALVGQIWISRFPHPEKLLPLPHGCFELTDASGQANAAEPGKNNNGHISQGWLEQEAARWGSFETWLVLLLLLILAALGLQSLWIYQRSKQLPTPSAESP